jgi:hypothetical protein
MNRQNSFSPHTITCECGFEIQLIPDAEAVGNTIDAHVEEHRRIQSDSEKGDIAAERVHDYLFNKLFEQISQVPL